MDLTGDHSEEDSPRQAYGVHDNGQPSSSEAPPVCRTGDQWDYSHQSILRYDGNNQTLDNSVPWET